MEKTKDGGGDLFQRGNVELMKYKYLSTIFDSMFTFASNSEEILRRCQQWQHFLRKLNTLN